MWQRLGHQPLIAHAGWPTIDESLLGTDLVICVIQINGKIKDRIEVSPDISDPELESLALSNPAIVTELANLGVVEFTKVIVRAPKLVNFVI
jgi:leucyl-tRNA synthetase